MKTLGLLRVVSLLLLFGGMATAVLVAQKTPDGKGASSTDGTETVASTEELTLQPVRPPTLSSDDADLLMGPLLCDSEGSVYVRKYQMDRPDQAPILKYDQSGARQSVFSITAASPELGGDYFTIAPDGELYEVASTKTDTVVVRYAKDGTVKSKTLLDTSFEADQIAVFSSGQFLIAGMENDTEARPGYRPAFTALFDSSGKMVMKLSLEDDKAIQEAVDRGDNYYVPEGSKGPNMAIGLGTATSGNDGNIYLMRRTSPALIYAISASGQVVKRFSVDPGDPALLPMGLAFSEGRIAVYFTKINHRGDPGDRVMKVISASDGEEIASYRVAKALGDGFTCFTPEGFTFVGVSNNRIALYHVEPR